MWRDWRLGVEMSSIFCWHREQLLPQRGDAVLSFDHQVSVRNVPPLHFIRGSQVIPAALFVCSFKWLLSIQIWVVCTNVSYPWRTSTKTSATFAWPFGTWGSAMEWGEEPIRMGQYATAGLNRSLKVGNGRSRFRNVRKHEKPVTFLKWNLKISEF